MSNDIDYTTFKYPCLDKYKPGSGFISDNQIQSIASQKLRSLKSHKGSSKRDQLKVFKKLKAAFKVSAIWDTEKYPIMKIHFLDGTKKQKDWVQYMVMKDIAPITTKFTWDWNSTIDDAMIRISFALPKQAWSYVGTDCLTIPKPQPTMNLGWLDDDETYNSSEKHKNTGQVVLHEFGHMLGMIHEHTNPKSNTIVWNRKVVYAELFRTNGWNPEQVDHNMFEKYGDAEACDVAKNLPEGVERDAAIKNMCQGTLVNGSEYDIHSIMHYWYPPSWIESGPTEIPVNLVLSEKDREWLSKYYGNSTKVDDDEDDKDDDEDDDEVNEKPKVPTQEGMLQNAISIIDKLLSDKDIDDDIVDSLQTIKKNIEAAECICDTSQDVGDPNFGNYIIYFLIFAIILYIVISFFSSYETKN